MQLVFSAQKTNAVSQGALKLAMLDLDKHQYKRQNKRQAKRSYQRSKRIKRYISRRRPIIAKLAPKGATNIASANCLSWSASKIHARAKQFEKLISKYSALHHVDKNLVKSIITAESCFRVKAKSHANAQGLMQLIPATAKRFGVKNSYNASQNISGGVKYLKFLKERYNGDLKKVIAAYNAGEGAVDKYKGIPPYKETKNYVRNVLKTYEKLKPKKPKRVKAVYHPPKLGNKAGRYGWQYNRRLAPHLYKQ